VTPTEEQCENGVDDDCNGKIDCQDPACEPCSITFYSNDTWTVPTGVTVVWLTGTGGGGGGGGFGTGSTEGYPGGCMYPQYGCYQGGGGGGGGAAAVEKFEVAVTAGTTYTIVVGQGGTQSAPYQIGVGGSATTFADLLTLPGGGGASNVFNGSPGGPGGPGGQPGEQGGDHGGKGGDTLFGVGGGGSAGGSPGTGYGSGGGGTTWSATGSGGSGAPGFLTIEW
jgi:hypothetical protein